VFPVPRTHFCGRRRSLDSGAGSEASGGRQETRLEMAFREVNWLAPRINGVEHPPIIGSTFWRISRFPLEFKLIASSLVGLMSLLFPDEI
jgi:hypothetical protein